MKLAIFYLISLAAITIADDTDLSRVLRNGNNQFTTRMFSEVLKEKPHESVVISAYSVLTPLAQCGLASVAESHDELLKTIGMPDDNVTKAVFSQAESRIRSIKGVELKTASKIYIAKNYELNEQFAATTRDVFNSEVKNVDFTQSQKTANEINSWVEDQTNKRIKDLVDPNSLDSDTRALLVNAIYFKGLWKNPFSTYATYEQNFHVNNDKTVKIPMMYQKNDFNYAEVPELDAKILEMFYTGEEASIVIVLPNKVEGITELEEKLKDPTALDKGLSNLYKTEVEVTIPKFKIETTTDLKKVLQKMDVKKLFAAGQARLDNLLKGASDLYVSQAIQKTFIEVNEEGAEAGAANVFAVGYDASFFEERPKIFKANIFGVRYGISFFEEKLKIFKADRPFYFEIKLNNLTIFNGVKID